MAKALLMLEGPRQDEWGWHVSFRGVFDSHARTYPTGEASLSFRIPGLLVFRVSPPGVGKWIDGLVALWRGIE